MTAYEKMEKEYEVNGVLPELKKLKGFFLDAVKRGETRPDMVAGYFGPTGIFFGNVIQHCSFNIPASAMKLIYEANRENIDNKIKRLEDLKVELSKIEV